MNADAEKRAPGTGSVELFDVSGGRRSQLELTEPLRLLLVEDSPGDAVLVQEELRRNAGQQVFEVIHVARAGDALNHLHDPAPACVLLDLGLPDAAGLDALLAIRTSSEDVPVVVLTGRDDEPLGVMALRRGAQDYLVKGRVDGPALSRAIRYAIERARLEAQLKHLALHDPLTGLANRALFMDRLAMKVARARRNPGEVMAVMVLDLDHFKTINDSLGHAAGDHVLREVAGRLRTALRPGDTVARMGGDEFALLCEADEASEAPLIARRLLDSLGEPVVVGGEDIFVGASIGVALAHGDTDPSALLRDADVAMYRAKGLGRGRFEMIDQEMRFLAQRRLANDRALHRALERREFRLVYQPTVNLHTGAIAGVEALLRWDEPERGLLGPDEFIASAEESGLIVPIGEWVLATTLQQAMAWQELAEEPFTIAVNLSARQLLEPTLVDSVATVLHEAGYPASSLRLHLEITETAMMRDRAAASLALTRLKGLGVQIAVDDFGTGFASFSYVRQLPVDVLKVDRSFVVGLGENDQDRAIVSSVISIGGKLGLTVVAEGVETALQLRALKELGCGLAQGFHFSPPLGAEAMTELLRQQPRW